MAMAMPDQTRDQIIAACPVDRGFASRIDLGNSDHICVVETGAELVEVMAQARVAVRLVHGDHPLARCALW